MADDQLNEVQKQWAALKERRDRLRELVSQAQRQVFEARARQTLRVGQEKKLDQRSWLGPMKMVLRYDHLYFWHKYDSKGNRCDIIFDEMIVLEDGLLGVETTPNPARGIPLTSPDARGGLRSAFARLQPGRHYSSAAVYPDSFDVFHLMRELSVEIRLPYQIWIMDEDTVLHDRGGTGAHVK